MLFNRLSFCLSIFLAMIFNSPMRCQELPDVAAQESGTSDAQYIVMGFEPDGTLANMEIPGWGNIEIALLPDELMAILMSLSDGNGDQSDQNGLTAFGPPPIPNDRTQPPGPDWEWRGPEPVGYPPGAWHNPGTGESLQPDLEHLPPKGPHWGYTDPYGNVWDYFPATGEWKPHPANKPNRPKPTFPEPESPLDPEFRSTPQLPVPPIVPPFRPFPVPPAPTPPVRPISPGFFFRIIPLFMFDFNFGLEPDPNNNLA